MWIPNLQTIWSSNFEYYNQVKCIAANAHFYVNKDYDKVFTLGLVYRSDNWKQIIYRKGTSPGIAPIIKSEIMKGGKKKKRKR